jgi:flagellar basal body-associated protein FliL
MSLIEIILVVAYLAVVFWFFNMTTPAEPPLKFHEIDPNLLPIKETTA